MVLRGLFWKKRSFFLGNSANCLVAREGLEQRFRPARAASGGNELYGHHDCRKRSFRGSGVLHMKPDGLVEVQWGQAQFRVCNPAGGKSLEFTMPDFEGTQNQRSFTMGMIGCVCSRLSSDINALALKKKQQNNSTGLCGDGSIYMGG